MCTPGTKRSDTNQENKTRECAPREVGKGSPALKTPRSGGICEDMAQGSQRAPGNGCESSIGFAPSRTEIKGPSQEIRGRRGGKRGGVAEKASDSGLKRKMAERSGRQNPGPDDNWGFRKGRIKKDREKR